MTKCVLDVGNCPPDHAAIRDVIETNFDAEVIQAHRASDALAILQERSIALVLVNRKLDVDYSDGLAIVTQIKAAPSLAGVPVMMVTNYEDHQQRAVEAGAEHGFGKLSLAASETLDRLRRFLN